MGKLSSLLWGAAIGAGLMYFQDPQNGNRRKAMLRDQVDRIRNQGDEALDTAVHDLRNRARGVLAEGMSLISQEGLPDNIVEERIRARLGFLSRHTGAMQVSVQNGTAMLSGDVLADEVDHLVKGVGKVRGVRRVENNLRVHQDAGNIPQLQGEGWMPGQNGEMWSPAGRLLAGIGASYLLLYGVFRGGLVGLLAKGGGLYIGSRALTNMNLREIAGTSPEGVIRVRKSIQINAPVEEVYGLWSNFENFSRFMNNVQEIHTSGDDRSHWVVKGPAGSKVEFDAITTQNIPNELLSWETTPDSMVKHHGQVRFRKSGEGTQVNIQMAYTPPAGVAGHAVASLFGKDPKSEMDADLVRMKSLLETGKTTGKRGKVTREEMGSTAGEQRTGVPVTGIDSTSETDMGLGMGMEGDTGTDTIMGMEGDTSMSSGMGMEGDLRMDSGIDMEGDLSLQNEVDIEGDTPIETDMDDEDGGRRRSGSGGSEFGES
jgi:uncharacterized membrane protein